MLPSNVDIRRLGWFAIVAIFARLALRQDLGLAGPLIALPMGAVAPRERRARDPDRGLCSER